MKQSVYVFAIICSLVLLATVIPMIEGSKRDLKHLLHMMDDKRLKRRIVKKLVKFYMVAGGHKKIYAIPFPLPIPIPILKKLQPIIYKETVPYPVPIPYGGDYGGY